MTPLFFSPSLLSFIPPLLSHLLRTSLLFPRSVKQLTSPSILKAKATIWSDLKSLLLISPRLSNTFIFYFDCFVLLPILLHMFRPLLGNG